MTATALTKMALPVEREVQAAVQGQPPHCRPSVRVERLPTAHWFIGQRAAPRPTALLEISITAGTNTAAQKAEFIAATWAELQMQLGAGDSLEDASYVVVREIPATDWGYGGHTQQARKVLRTGG